MPSDQVDLDDLDRKIAAATPGPLCVQVHADNLVSLIAVERGVVASYARWRNGDAGPQGAAEADAMATAALRNAAPALIAELRAARAELADWKESARNAATEDCAYAMHCTCVGPLRAELARRDAELREARELLRIVLDRWDEADDELNYQRKPARWARLDLAESDRIRAYLERKPDGGGA